MLQSLTHNKHGRKTDYLRRSVHVDLGKVLLDKGFLRTPDLEGVTHLFFASKVSFFKQIYRKESSYY